MFASLLGLYAVLTTAVSPAPVHLCPYGVGLDNVATVNDDRSVGPISIPAFKYYNKINHRLYVNTNGLISFNGQISTYTPRWFPQKSYYAIAPYWADVDTRVNKGRIYYRKSINQPYIGKLSAFVQKEFSNNFKATWFFVATWHRVTFYGGSSTTPMSTFQVVIVANRAESYVMFNYGDIAWTTGKASKGDENGLDGYPAEVALASTGEKSIADAVTPNGYL
ncbi:Sushi, nidogen and EGF-like domain-containing protein 1 [Lamellibrachia satsuma]|nr:Sushi, nidogen and EGF-like domain-containing protein 1 [Lamellibrachia satsuma]